MQLHPPLTFIMSNIPINVSSYRQWQIFLHAIQTNQRRWSRLLQQNQHVQIVQLNSPPILPHAHIHVRYMLSFFSKERDVASLTLRTHITPRWQFFSVSPSPNTLVVSLCLVLSPFHLLIHARVFWTGTTLVLITWKVSLFCVLWQIRSRASSRLWWRFIHHELVRFIHHTTFL